jgi:putative transposase
VPSGTIGGMTTGATLEKPSRVLASHTGVSLSRPTTFRFTLDPNRAQHRRLLAHAGAARLAYNHQIGRVKANLAQLAAERSYGVAESDLTPSLSWSKVSFINHMNAWEVGRAADTGVALDTGGSEVRGLAWRGEVSTDVLSARRSTPPPRSGTGRSPAKASGPGRRPGSPGSRAGTRARPRSGSGPNPNPDRRRPSDRPARGACGCPSSASSASMSTPAGSPRCLGPAGFTCMRPASGSSTGGGLWPSPVSRPSCTTCGAPRGTGTRPGWVGVDLGVKTLAVACDEHGRVLHTWEGVKALQHAQTRLRLANQSYSRTKSDSAGRKKAAIRLGKIHARVAHLRAALLHNITAELARSYTSVTVEDLNVAGMLQLRSLARHISDAAFGEFRRQLEYKAAWYGTQVVVADRCSRRPRRAPGAGMSTRT